jgi:hypothetical protein
MTVRRPPRRSHGDVSHLIARPAAGLDRRGYLDDEGLDYELDVRVLEDADQEPTSPSSRSERRPGGAAGSAGSETAAR